MLGLRKTNGIAVKKYICNSVIQLCVRDLNSGCGVQCQQLAYSFGRLRAVTKPKQSKPNTDAEHYFFTKVKKTFDYTNKDSLRLYIFALNFIDTHANNVELIDAMIECIGEHFKANDVLVNPTVFNLHPNTLNNRIQVLKEMGFDSLKVEQINAPLTTLFKRSPNELKLSNSYDKRKNVLNHFLSNIECPETLSKDIERELNYLPVKHVDLISFDTIRQISIVKYLSFKLDCSYDEAFNIFESKRKTIYSLTATSFTNLDLVINFLLNEIKFSTDIIKLYPIILTADYKNVQTIYKNRYNIFGLRFWELCFNCPLILKVKYTTLQNNVTILKEFGFSDDQILNHSFILTRTTKSIKKYLDIFAQSDDFQRLKNDDCILGCVSHMTEAVLAFEQLKLEGVDSSSITARQIKNKILWRYRRSKSYVSTKVKLEAYLLEKFGVQLSALSPKIGAHPLEGRLWVSTTNANQILEFLMARKLTTEQILNGIYVLLYEFNSVKNHYEMMRCSQELQPFDTKWKTNPFLLRLLLYYIEKDYSFSGIGVYCSRNKKVYESKK